VKPDPIIFELLAFRPVRDVLLLLLFLAVTLTLSYARAEEAGITARIGGAARGSAAAGTAGKLADRARAQPKDGDHSTQAAEPRRTG